MNCSSDLKTFANSQPSASNFKSFSRSLEHFFLTVGQNNFGNKIAFRTVMMTSKTKKSISVKASKNSLNKANRIITVQDSWFFFMDKNTLCTS